MPSHFFQQHSEQAIRDRQYLLMAEHKSFVPLDMIEMRDLIYLSDKTVKQINEREQMKKFKKGHK